VRTGIDGSEQLRWFSLTGRSVILIATAWTLFVLALPRIVVLGSYAAFWIRGKFHRQDSGLAVFNAGWSTRRGRLTAIAVPVGLLLVAWLVARRGSAPGSP
jgi:hypothetical protein